jgi:hypothetical protein
MENPVKRSRKLWVLLGVPLAIVAAVIVSGLILGGGYTTEQTAQRNFTIEEDFTKVRKIMVRTDASKEIVTMGGDSEFVDQQWSEAAVNAAGENIGESLLQVMLSADPDWRIELDGTLHVRTLDEYVGQNVIKLEQHVEIVPDRIESRTKLVEGSERLLDYALLTRLSRDGEKTKVELELTQKIKTHAPWYAHFIADRRVRASAARALEHQETAMRQFIKDNADKAGLFPLR